MCFGWALVRVLGIEAAYPAVPLMTYTLFVFPVALLATVVGAALRQWPAAGVAALASVMLAAVIAPRAIGGPDSFHGVPVRLVSANVFHGHGDATRLVEYARERRADVLCVEELTPAFARHLRRAGVSDLLPNRVLAVHKGVSGSGIYSRFPLRRIPLSLISSSRAVASINPALKLEVMAVHNLPVPTSQAGVDGWGTSLRSLPAATTAGSIQVLAGDFNATLDQSAFRDLLDRGYYDAAERMGDGLIPTWPAIRGSNRYLPVTIDHVLYDRHRAGVRDYDVLDLPGSDHRTIYAELVLRWPESQ